MVDDLLQDAVDGVTNALEVPPHAGEEAEDPRETREELRDREACDVLKKKESASSLFIYYISWTRRNLFYKI